MNALIILLDVDVGLSDILHEVARVIPQFYHHLQCLVVLENTIGEMPHEVVFTGVAMQLVYDPYLFVYLVDILCSLILGDLYIDVTIEDELATFIEFMQLEVETVHEEA